MAIASGAPAWSRGQPKGLVPYLLITSLLLAAASVEWMVNAGWSVKDLLLPILPAMAANGTPVLTPRILAVLGASPHRIDGGLRLGGRDLLGRSKTVEGFLIGLAAGTVAGAVIYRAFGPGVPWDVILASSTGALVGDLAGSFVKRRLGIESGDPLPLLDQADFLLGAYALLYAVNGPIASSWEGLASVFLLVYGLHVSTNCIAYIAGLKETCP